MFAKCVMYAMHTFNVYTSCHAYLAFWLTACTVYTLYTFVYTVHIACIAYIVHTVHSVYTVHTASSCSLLLAFEFEFNTVLVIVAAFDARIVRTTLVSEITLVDIVVESCGCRADNDDDGARSTNASTFWVDALSNTSEKVARIER